MNSEPDPLGHQWSRGMAGPADASLWCAACNIMQTDDRARDVCPSEPDPLTLWWLAEAQIEAQKLVPKAQEYGSYDLQLIGEVLGDMTAAANPDMELGIIFYLIGKIARLASAARDGHRPSDDTYIDIAIYARMALYIREHGRWP